MVGLRLLLKSLRMAVWSLYSL